ncbi:unnamed protein product [Allacma fusca]|uniref:C2H2-type domain-containing protein n=1 Tax=Allacma fusca TaxID=39272 RepID=A0A8J2PHF5_9HEXA|nr:unnamed protein product [Allacma fusca]
MREENDWVTRIIKLESDISKWKRKFEVESLWKTVVQDWIFNEFGFDISARVKLMEQSLRTNRVIDVSFSTKNSDVDFEELRTELINSRVCRNKSNGNIASPETMLSQLPESIEVTEVQTLPARGQFVRKQPELIVEAADTVDETELEVNLDYSLEYDLNGDDDDDRREYPLTIYDDDDTMDTSNQDNIASFGSGAADDTDDPLVYKSDNLEFTVVEPADNEDSKSDHSQNPSSQYGYRIRTNKSLIQTIYFPGHKRKFQCRACSRIFNDRGNGHRHVRRMHPGSSLAEQRRAETERFLSTPPVLEPEINLNENSEFDQEMDPYAGNSEDDEDEFEDEKESIHNDALGLTGNNTSGKGLDKNGGVGRLSAEKRNAAAKLIRKLDESRYECIQCGRLFSVSCNARRHVRVVHFGERLYACQLCQKLFSSKTDGLIHERTCMGRKIRKIEGSPPSFECKMCSSRYTDLQSAWFHAKKMHLVDSEKPHKCPHCPRSYFNRKDLLRHIEKCGATAIFNEGDEDSNFGISVESRNVESNSINSNDSLEGSQKETSENNSDFTVVQNSAHTISDGNEHM